MDSSTHAGTGEREARLRALYTNYPDLLRFVSRRVHPSHAEDVVAETFAVAWRRLDDVPRDQAMARAWLFGTARHCLLNERRGQARQQALAVRIAQARPPDQRLEPELLAQRIDLEAAWHRLNPAEQETLALTLWDALTGPEAARVLGITPIAYRLRLTRARASLRKHLSQPAESAEPAATTNPLKGRP